MPSPQGGNPTPTTQAKTKPRIEAAYASGCGPPGGMDLYGRRMDIRASPSDGRSSQPVSYTHLTLPTNREV